MIIPLPKGLRGDKSYGRQIEILSNCYYHNADIPTIKSRPVSTGNMAGFGRCRGAGKFAEELYQVSNDRLIRITINNPELPPSNGNVSIVELGAIPGGEQCSLVSSFTQLVIIVHGGQGYTYNKTDGLREITSVGFTPSVMVDYDPNGNWIFIPSNGDPFFFCTDVALLADPNAVTFRFADAQEFTDKNKAIAVRKRQIFVGGTTSFERLSYNPDLDTYVPIMGASSRIGYMGGMCLYGETFMFLGTTDTGGVSIYMMQDQPVSIASDYVTSVLETYAPNDLKSIRAHSFTYGSTTFACFYLPDLTLVYSGDWSIWHSGVNGEVNKPWTVGYMQEAYGYVWTADHRTRAIGVIDEGDTEYGDILEGLIQTYIRTDARLNDYVNRVVVALNTGYSKSGQMIGLQVSKDGVLFGGVNNINLGNIAHYNREISWGPIGRFQGALSLRIRWAGAVRLIIDRIEVTV